MTAILSVFKGEATLGDAPDQVFETTTTRPATTTTATTVAEATADDENATATSTSTTLPVIEAEENTVGIVPDRDAVCN